MSLAGQAWAVGMPSEPTAVGSDRVGDSEGPGSIVKKLSVDTFSLPEYLGHIKDLSKGEGSEKTVIHIQDAHCNYAAQQKISEIIEYLNKEYGIDTINLEGGARDYDLSVFTSMPDKAIREKTADYFVKEGLVNGAEYFAINNPEKATLWGIEDTKLYIDNLNVYRDSLKYKDEVDKHLKSLSHILSNLKTKIYSQELLDLDIKYSQYKAGNLEFKDYLSFLIQAAKNKAIDIKGFTNIYLLSQTLAEEGNIDFKKADNQRDDLIDKLQKKFSKKSLEELVVKTVEFRSEKISQKEFYAYLIKKADLVSIELNNFPDLQKYVVYISMYNAIDKMKVMEEMDKIENAVKESFYQNDKERDLSRLSKNLAILKNIFSISLTKEDYKYYLDNEQSFNASNYVSFIDREAPLYSITAQLDKNITDLDRHRENISKFYEYSFKRDGAFLNNIKFTTSSLRAPQGRSNPKNAAILITGGFHTDNLCEMLKKQNVAYISIMPNFKSDNGYESPYFRILAGKPSLIESKMSALFSSALATPDLFNQISALAYDNKQLAALNFHIYWVLSSRKALLLKHGDEILGAIDPEGNIYAKDNLPAINFETVFATQFTPSLQLSAPEKIITSPPPIIVQAATGNIEPPARKIEPSPLSSGLLSQVFKGLALKIIIAAFLTLLAFPSFAFGEADVMRWIKNHYGNSFIFVDKEGQFKGFYGFNKIDSTGTLSEIGPGKDLGGIVPELGSREDFERISKMSFPEIMKTFKNSGRDYTGNFTQFAMAYPGVVLQLYRYDSEAFLELALNYPGYVNSAGDIILAVNPYSHDGAMQMIEEIIYKNQKGELHDDKVRYSLSVIDWYLEKGYAKEFPGPYEPVFTDRTDSANKIVEELEKYGKDFFKTYEEELKNISTSSLYSAFRAGDVEKALTVAERLIERYGEGRVSDVSIEYILIGLIKGSEQLAGLDPEDKAKMTPSDLLELETADKVLGKLNHLYNVGNLLKKAKEQGGRNPSGSWFKNAAYIRRFASPVETIVSIGLGTAIAAILSYFGLSDIASVITGAIASGGIFWLGHVFYNPEAIRAPPVIRLAVATCGVATIIGAHVFGSISGHTGLIVAIGSVIGIIAWHYAVNWGWPEPEPDSARETEPSPLSPEKIITSQPTGIANSVDLTVEGMIAASVEGLTSLDFDSALKKIKSTGGKNKKDEPGPQFLLSGPLTKEQLEQFKSLPFEVMLMRLRGTDKWAIRGGNKNEVHSPLADTNSTDPAKQAILGDVFIHNHPKDREPVISGLDILAESKFPGATFGIVSENGIKFYNMGNLREYHQPSLWDFEGLPTKRNIFTGRYSEEAIKKIEERYLGMGIKIEYFEWADLDINNICKDSKKLSEAMRSGTPRERYWALKYFLEKVDPEEGKKFLSAIPEKSPIIEKIMEDRIKAMGYDIDGGHRLPRATEMVDVEIGGKRQLPSTAAPGPATGKTEPSPLSSFTPKDSEVGRNPDIAAILTSPLFIKVAGINPDAEVTVVDVGVGALPFSTIELKEVLDSCYENVSVIGTELASATPGAHITSGKMLEEFRKEAAAILRIIFEMNVKNEDLNDLRLAVDKDNRPTEVLVGFRIFGDRQAYRTLAVAPDVVYRVRGKEVTRDLVRGTDLFNRIVEFTGGEEEIAGLVKGDIKKDGVNVELDPIGKMLGEQGIGFIAANDISEKINGADIITASNVTVHMDDAGKEAFLSQMKRALNENGLLLVKSIQISEDRIGNYKTIECYKKTDGQMRKFGEVKSTMAGELISFEGEFGKVFEIDSSLLAPAAAPGAGIERQAIMDKSGREYIVNLEESESGVRASVQTSGGEGAGVMSVDIVKGPTGESDLVVPSSNLKPEYMGNGLGTIVYSQIRKVLSKKLPKGYSLSAPVENLETRTAVANALADKILAARSEHTDDPRYRELIDAAEKFSSGLKNRLERLNLDFDHFVVQEFLSGIKGLRKDYPLILNLSNQELVSLANAFQPSRKTTMVSMYETRGSDPKTLEIVWYDDGSFGFYGMVKPAAAPGAAKETAGTRQAATVEAFASEIASHLNEEPLALIDNTRTMLMPRLNALLKEGQVAFIQGLLTQIDSTLTGAERTNAHLAIRAVLGAEAVSEIEPGTFDVVTQIVPLEIKSKIPGEINEANREMREKSYGANAKSIEVPYDRLTVDLESQIDVIVKRMVDTMQDKPKAMGLMYVPSHLLTDAGRSKLQSITQAHPNIKVQITKEEDEYPDVMTLFELGVKLLDYERNKAKGIDPSQSLLNLLAAVAASDQNPIDILNNLFNFGHTLRIRKIDLSTIEQAAEAMQLVRQAL